MKELEDFHLEIVYHNKNYYLKDLGTKSGTFVKV